MWGQYVLVSSAVSVVEQVVNDVLCRSVLGKQWPHLVMQS